MKFFKQVERVEAPFLMKSGAIARHNEIAMLAVHPATYNIARYYKYTEATNGNMEGGGYVCPVNSHVIYTSKEEPGVNSKITVYGLVDPDRVAKINNVVDLKGVAITAVGTT